MVVALISSGRRQVLTVLCSPFSEKNPVFPVIGCFVLEAWIELHSTGDGTSISCARAHIYYIGVAVSCADGASVEGRKNMMS